MKAPERTSEFNAKVPIVGIIREIDSSLRELVCAEVSDDFDSVVFSRAAKIKKTEPKNPAVRTDQSADESVKTDLKIARLPSSKLLKKEKRADF